MNHIDRLESKSVFIIREAYRKFKDIAMLWSIGKDSTTLLWLCRKAFFGKIPFPVVHIDTGYKFKEMIEWRDEYAEKWNLNLIVGQNKDAIEKGIGPKDKLACCTALKTNALKQTIKEQGYKALLLGIRRDEHGIRAKERVFSPRNIEFKWDYKNQPPELWDQYKTKKKKQEHIRVHPILHWREVDIWEYIKRENIPIIDMYFAKNGKRFRSLGCECCCSPVKSSADDIDKMINELKTTHTSERDGRAQDKENAYMMQKLRSLGYM
ncbi:sulfate adenylyltransferase subunit CysD [Candidatus Woesearchaeota archaeon]|nr:sulfate adenylyltransferase subunit CysD [Candidatus Woesearchaeota archaeon]